MLPSVSRSGRISKPTPKAQSASACTLCIRTIEIKQTKSFSSLNPLHSPMSTVFSRPSNSTDNNDTAQQLTSPHQSPCPSQQTGGPTWPGSTHPVTPQSTISSLDKGSNDKSDNNHKPPTDREVFFTATTLAKL
jgi:hypothetical protein